MQTEKIYIYRIYFLTSDKCYIGQTNNLDRRMKDHLRSGSLVCKALYKYDEWQVSILHTCQSRDEANRIEIEEIRNFKSVAPNGYNLTHGGEGGDKSDETKRKMSEVRFGKIQTEETKNKISDATKGKIVSENTKNKMHIVHLGVARGPHTEATKEKISQTKLGSKHTKATKLKIKLGHLIRNMLKLEDELKD